MTTKTTTYFTTLLCLALVLSSCLSDPINPPYNGEEKGMVIQFDATTRGAADVVQLQTGYLFMVSDFGTIIRYFVIHESTGRGTNTVLNPGYIYIGHLREGVPINAVPDGIQQVVVAGNTILTRAPAVGMRISDIRVQQISVLTQHDISRVNLWGETHRNNTRLWRSTQQHYTVEVELFPTVARIELQAIQACPASEIETFNVAGIFVDRHYYLAQVDGTMLSTLANNIVSRGHNSALFRPGQRGYTDYDTGRALFDYFTPVQQATGSPLAVTSGDIPWAYNLFATRRVQDGGGVNYSPMPSLVIRLNSVQLRGQDLPMVGDFYITVRGIINRNTGTLLPGIRARHIYQLSPVVFTEQHLSDRPNEVFIDTEVEIALALWNDVPVQAPGFHQPAPMNVSVCCPPVTHRFELGAAQNSDCSNRANPMRYRWQRSADGGITWTYFSEISTDTYTVWTTPAFTPSFHFRRVAICGCGQRHHSQPALLTTPVQRVYNPLWSPTTDPGVLIAGTVWATRNVGRPGYFVNHPTDPGILFQFHGIAGHSNFDPRRSWSPGSATWDTNTVAWNTNSVTGSAPWGTNNTGPCPEGWRLPTSVELRDLVNASTGTGANFGANIGVTGTGGFTTNRGQWMLNNPSGAFACEAGMIFGEPEGNHIFFPVTGYRHRETAALSNPMDGLYWSSTQSGTNNAWGFQFFNRTGHNTLWMETHWRAYGFSVRCVQVP